MGPLNTLDSDVPPEYQTNSGPLASTRGRIVAVSCEHISGLEIKHGWYGISNGKARGRSHLASIMLELGLLVPGPVGLHLIV